MSRKKPADTAGAEPKPRTRAERDAERDVRRQARRVELLEAAVQVIRRDGPHASMERIATEAGVTKPIVYRHFDDRDGLVAAVAERFVVELMDELRASLSRNVEPRELLRATIDTYLAFVERDTQLYRFLVTQARVGPTDAGDALTGFMNQVGQAVTIAIGENLRAFGGDSGAAEPWAYGIVGMVHFAGDWWMERQTMPRDRLVDYLVSLLWDGMGTVVASAGADHPRFARLGPEPV